MLLLDDGCYANMYTNLTKAFKLKIVGFTGVSRWDAVQMAVKHHPFAMPPGHVQIQHILMHEHECDVAVDG
jgi:hypothetical protein